MRGMRSAKPSLGAIGTTLAGAPSKARTGLRERKKASTRARISDLATAMFLARGFDAVTVAEVAAAADVSVKTVFNYFGTKEDLIFDREPEWVASIEALAARREPGRGLIRVLRDDVRERWPALEFGRWEHLTDESAQGRRSFYALVAGHPALRARQRQMSERVGAAIAAAVVREFGDPDSPEALTAAALVHAAYEGTGREYARQLLDGAPAGQVVARARAVGVHGLEQLERLYAGTPLVDGPAG